MFGAAKVSAGAGQDLQVLEEQRAVEMAARRITFLEICPEHSCAEQEPMLKAFVRRHWAVAEQARADVIAERAAAWEAMHSSSRSPLNSDEQGSCTNYGEPCSDGNDDNGSASDTEVVGSYCFSQSFKRAYEAYISYSERHTERQSVADNVQSRSFLKADSKRSWSFLQADDKRGVNVSGRSVEQRGFESLASAWESHNRPRIGAVRFADTHAEQGAASVAAVLELTVVKRKLMCDCEVRAVSGWCGGYIAGKCVFVSMPSTEGGATAPHLP